MTSALEALAPGFLIAAPSLRDPNFDHALLFMCVHNDDGAMGLVLNRPAPLSVGDVMVQVGIESDVSHPQSVFFGGPVAMERGMLLYDGAGSAETYAETLAIGEDLHLCQDKEIIRAIACGGGPSRFELFLGHAGWAPGQLETEIAQGAWIPTDYSKDLIFETPVGRRWETAIDAAGLTTAGLSTYRPHS